MFLDQFPEIKLRAGQFCYLLVRIAELLQVEHTVEGMAVGAGEGLGPGNQRGVTIATLKSEKIYKVKYINIKIVAYYY